MSRYNNIVQVIGEEFEDFTLGGLPDESVDEYADYCESAKSFALWAVELINTYAGWTTSADSSGFIKLQQAKIQLVDKYFEWRSYVPRSHKDKTSSTHVCIYHVFCETYSRLKRKELSIFPPPIFSQPLIEDKRRQKQDEREPMYGIYFGEEVGDN